MQLTDLAHAYHEQLDEQGYAYFAEAGISPRIVDEFGLGWVDQPLLAQHESVLDQPVFPYWTVTGKAVQLRFNALAHDLVGEHDRLTIGVDFPLSVPRHHLYNVRHTLPGLRTAQVLLCSDVRTVLLARQAGWRAVAAPGFANWYEPWNHLFDDARIVMAWSQEQDSAAEDVARQLKHRGIEILPVRLPEGESLASILGPEFPRGTDLVEVVASLQLDITSEETS